MQLNVIIHLRESEYTHNLLKIISLIINALQIARSFERSKENRGGNFKLNPCVCDVRLTNFCTVRLSIKILLHALII